MDNSRKLNALPVRKVRNTFEQIADDLRNLITEGVVRPGDQLPSEAQMAENFGVSRNTIREALKIVNSQGLIYSSRGSSGGTFVTQPDKRAMQETMEVGLGLMSGANQISDAEIHEVRLLIEVPAAELAAIHRSDEDLKRMRSAAKCVEEGHELHHRTDHSVDFHQAVLDAAGNRLLGLIVPPVWRVFAANAKRSKGRPHLWQDIDHDHIDILHHIEAQNPKEAAEAMRTHLMRLFEN